MRSKWHLRNLKLRGKREDQNGYALQELRVMEERSLEQLGTPT